MFLNHIFIIVFIFSDIISLNAFKWNPFGSESNACGMTSMWRYPLFLDVGFKHNFPHYSLWLYGEGLYAQKFLRDKTVDGLPIIFVPGNGGSGKQARSIGSVLQNKTEMRNVPFHFDTFTLDFNEQFSGLSSTVLLKQADFLEVAIDHIWKMYAKPPPGIIFIGHSMGGIVIREVIRRASFDINKISLILTFATPHLRPPIIIDSGMHKLWENIETSWNETRLANSHVRVVSISSGLKDELIAETFARSNNPTVYHYVTTGIDRVWIEADHQCIVWCNQLVRHTSRIIFYYAEKLGSFRQKVDSAIKMFYSGADRELKIIPLPKEGFQNYIVCPENETCIDKGVVEISKSSDKLILAIGPVSNYQLISSESCFPYTRYLTDKSYFSLVETNECNDGTSWINTNASKLWIVNASQIYLSSLNLKSSIFQHTEARRFTITKGIRRLHISFEDVTPTSVFVILITRKCESNIGDFRAIFEVNGIQRFDEFLKENSRIIRILSHSRENGILTFLDSEKCSYQIKIEQDWKNTLKLAMLEWAGTVPFLVFIGVCFFVYSTSLFGFNSISFILINSMGFIFGTYLFNKIPFIIYFTAFVISFIIQQISIKAHMFLTRKFSLRRPPSMIWNTLFFIGCICLTLFLHPFIGSLIAAIITSIQNRRTSPLSSAFKLLFITLISIPGVVHFIEVFKHNGTIIHHWDYFTLSTVFFIFTSFFSTLPHFWIASIVFATLIPVAWSLNFTSYIYVIDFLISITTLFYTWSLK